MPNAKALLQLLEKQATVKEVPNMFEGTNKAVQVPRPGKNITAAPGPTDATSTIQPTNPEVLIDPRISKLGEEELQAVLARAASELQDQKIGTMSPMLTPQSEFRESGVPMSDARIESQQLRDNLGVLDNDNSTSALGAGHVTVNDPYIDPIQSMLDFIDANKRGSDPRAIAEYMRGRNSTADYQQGSNIARSNLAGKSGLDPFDFETDYVPTDQFRALNESYKRGVADTANRAKQLPAIQKSSKIGPSSTNAAAERGLDVQTFNTLNPNAVPRDLADMLEALKLSRTPYKQGASDIERRIATFGADDIAAKGRPQTDDPMEVIQRLEEGMFRGRTTNPIRTEVDILDNPQYQEQLLKIQEAAALWKRIKQGNIAASEADAQLMSKVLGQQKQKLQEIADRLVAYRNMFDELGRK